MVRIKSPLREDSSRRGEHKKNKTQVHVFSDQEGECVRDKGDGDGRR